MFKFPNNRPGNTEPKTKVRMPDTAMKKALHKRYGYHCRFCGIPVIYAEIRKYLHKIYPKHIP
jgi:predicted restriction endonuclease